MAQDGPGWAVGVKPAAVGDDVGIEFGERPGEAGPQGAEGMGLLSADRAEEHVQVAAGKHLGVGGDVSGQ
ncbi:MAG TPA: hypothetical protein VGR74_19075 [Actinomycetota bacterium]|nr:hypothetical protein [Actinomycetota bacterium]